MASHSTTLAWKIPWREKPGRVQSMGSLRVGHDWATSLSLFTFMLWRREWQPTPVFLPGESQWRWSLVGCRLRGRTESDTTELTWRQQQQPLSRVRLCNPMNYSSPASSARGIRQASILEWVAMPSSRGCSQPRDQTQVSHISGRFFTSWPFWEAQVPVILHLRTVLKLWIK